MSGDRLAANQTAFTRGLRTPQTDAVPPGLDPTRYAVYRDLVYRNLESLLSGGFPVLKATLPTEHWSVLVCEFLRDHRAQTPLFLELGQEFLSFLGEREQQGWEPGWLWELADYERIELALEIAPDPPLPAHTSATVDEQTVDECIPRLSTLARLLCYTYPVHRIGPGQEPPPEPTFILVYRDDQDEVQFMTLMPATAQLLALLEMNQEKTTAELLQQLSATLALPVEQLQSHALEQLEAFRQRGVVYYEQ